jgi:hypothetical protein
MHLSDDIITAYRDGQLAPAERAKAAGHLDTCAVCAARITALRATQERLQVLAPPVAYHVSPHAALQQFTVRRKDTFMKNPFRQPALVAAGLVVILAVALAFPPVQALASNFLGLFRVQQVRVVSVDPTAAQNYSTLLENNSERFQTILSQNMTITHNGSYQKFTNPSEAAAAAGFTLRLPTGAAPTAIEVNPAETADLTIDSTLMNSFLDALGRKDVVIPANLDGQIIHADIPSVVLSSLGDCPVDVQNGRPQSYPGSGSSTNCTRLIQFKSPTIQAPDGFPVVQLAEMMLQMSGMSAAQAREFSRTVDWASTLVIPVPTSRFTTIKDITVDGVQGNLVSASNNSSYTMIWVKDGYIYAIVGQGDPIAGLKTADSLR